MSFFSGLGERLRDSLRRSQEFLSSGLGTVLEPDRPITDALWEELEELLVAADLGAALAADFVNRGRSCAASSSTRSDRRSRWRSTPAPP